MSSEMSEVHYRPYKLDSPDKPPEETDDGSHPPRVILKLAIHTFAMFTLPFIAYFQVKNYVQNQYDMTMNQGFIYGAIAAVIAVNSVIASYIYQAFMEEGIPVKPPSAKK